MCLYDLDLSQAMQVMHQQMAGIAEMVRHVFENTNMLLASRGHGDASVAGMNSCGGRGSNRDQGAEDWKDTATTPEGDSREKTRPAPLEPAANDGSGCEGSGTAAEAESQRRRENMGEALREKGSSHLAAIVGDAEVGFASGVGTDTSFTTLDLAAINFNSYIQNRESGMPLSGKAFA